jgi:hypothetical protein
VNVALQGSFPAGKNQIIWKGLNDGGKKLTSGIYFFRLATERGTSTGKLILK